MPGGQSSQRGRIQTLRLPSSGNKLPTIFDEENGLAPGIILQAIQAGVDPGQVLLVNDQIGSWHVHSSGSLEQLLCHSGYLTSRQGAAQVTSSAYSGSPPNGRPWAITQDKHAQAEPLFKRALAIREKTLGPNHPHVATVLKNMGRLYRETGRVEEAKRFEERAQAIRSRNQ